MAHWQWRLSIILTFFIVLSGCVELAPPPPAPEIPTMESGRLLRIGIESNLAALRPILAEHLDDDSNRDNGQLTLFVTGSSDTLQKQLDDNELDSIFVYHKPADVSFWTTPFALDSIAIITHKSLTLQSLSRSELQQVFSGSVQNWSTLSGQNQPISLFVDGTESGGQRLFNERVMENRPFAVSAVVALQPETMLDTVAQTEGGIGFIPTSLIDEVNNPIQIVPVDHFFPQFNTVRSQQYPLTIPIYMATDQEPQGEMRKLAAWLQSAEGQQRVSEKFVQIGSQ